MSPKGMFTCEVVLLAVAVPHAWASTTFWSISEDPSNFFVPDQFSLVNSSTSSVTNVATLGDGSLGFNGGLVIGPGGGLYGIANDSFGASSLYGIQSNGAFSLIGTAGGLGFGFFDGLAWDSDNSTFYAGVEDSLGVTSLYSISTGGAPRGNIHTRLRSRARSNQRWGADVARGSLRRLASCGKPVSRSNSQS
jgi:hypothetical protein